jgi:hypothetical protein
MRRDNWTTNFRFFFSFQLQENGFESFKGKKKLGMEELHEIIFPGQKFEGRYLSIERERIKLQEYITEDSLMRTFASFHRFQLVK